MYNHLKAGRLTLLDMHKILKIMNHMYRDLNVENPFGVLALIPLAAVIILFAVVLTELVLRIKDNSAVFLTAVAELFIWFGMLLFVFLYNGGFQEESIFDINTLKISFLPILAVALAVVSGVLWTLYKRVEASSPSYPGNSSANWQQTSPEQYLYASDAIYSGSASSPSPSRAAFGGARRRIGASNGMRHCPNCGAPLQPDSMFCGNCGSPVK